MPPAIAEEKGWGAPHFTLVKAFLTFHESDFVVVHFPSGDYYWQNVTDSIYKAFICKSKIMYLNIN